MVFFYYLASTIPRREKPAKWARDSSPGCKPWDGLTHKTRAREGGLPCLALLRGASGKHRGRGPGIRGLYR